MMRYTVVDNGDYFEMTTMGYYPVGSYIRDPRDGHMCKVVRIEGKAYNGKKVEK